MKIVTQMIVGKGESGRFLKEVLENATQFSDTIIALEDKADQETIDLLRSFPKVQLFHHESPESIFSKDEGVLREMLWEHVRRFAEAGDWIVSLDCDELFDKEIVDTIQIAELKGAERINFRLCDMWTPTHYRVDGYWSPAITRAFRYRDLPYGLKGQLHVGCIPAYAWKGDNHFFAPDIRLKHLGWIRDEDKSRKETFYLERATGINLEHAGTISRKPTLMEWDHAPHRILVASLIRNRAWILPRYLDALDAQADHYGPEHLSFYFIVNDSTDDSRKILDAWAEKNKSRYEKITIREINFSNSDAVEHTWSDVKLKNMARMRDTCLREMWDGGQEYCFMVDSDVVLTHQDTLSHLAALERDVVSEVFWAKWENEDARQMPNVWLSGGYELNNGFIDQMHKPGVYEVGGLGACTLYHRSLVAKGVSFQRVRNLPSDMRGEDRDFCVRAACAGFRMYADTYKTPLHVERTKEQIEQSQEGKTLKDKSRDTVVKAFNAYRKKAGKYKKISLCMMVKNEQAMVANAIRSALPVVDEIVIVDTGSTDLTLQILEKFAAEVEVPMKILHAKWEDDFSAPRNLGIEHCTGDWILRIDADESIPLTNAIEFWRLAQQAGDTMAYLVPIKNYLQDPSKNKKPDFFISETCRLFVRHPKIRYRHAIHEEIDDSIHDLGTEQEVSITRVMTAIEHFGYLIEADRKKKKHEHYAEIIKSEISKRPEDPRPVYSLASHYHANKKYDLAADMYQRATELDPNFWPALNDLAVLRFYEGNYRAARELFERAKALVSASSASKNHKRRLALNAEDLDLVERRFKAMMVHPGSFSLERGQLVEKEPATK